MFEFLSAFYRIISKKDDPIMQKALMLYLISTVIRDNYQDALEDQRHLSVTRHIKDYIDAGNGFSMTLDDFANTFFYNKFHLERRFKARFGVSLIEYRNKKRMERAKLLLEGNSVSKVAQTLGYGSIYSFSRAYKLAYGHAPSQSRAKEEN